MLAEMTTGYQAIAVRDDRAGTTVISFNTDSKDFLLSVSGRLAGPFSLDDLKVLKDNIDDVINMSGRYLFIKSYDPLGEKTE